MPYVQPRQPGGLDMNKLMQLLQLMALMQAAKGGQEEKKPSLAGDLAKKALEKGGKGIAGALGIGGTGAAASSGGISGLLASLGLGGGPSGAALMGKAGAAGSSVASMLGGAGAGAGGYGGAGGGGALAAGASGTAPTSALGSIGAYAGPVAAMAAVPIIGNLISKKFFPNDNLERKYKFEETKDSKGFSRQFPGFENLTDEQKKGFLDRASALGVLSVPGREDGKGNTVSKGHEIMHPDRISYQPFSRGKVDANYRGPLAYSSKSDMPWDQYKAQSGGLVAGALPNEIGRNRNALFDEMFESSRVAKMRHDLGLDTEQAPPMRPESTPMPRGNGLPGTPGQFGGTMRGADTSQWHHLPLQIDPTKPLKQDVGGVPNDVDGLLQQLRGMFGGMPSQAPKRSSTLSPGVDLKGNRINYGRR